MIEQMSRRNVKIMIKKADCDMFLNIFTIARTFVMRGLKDLFKERGFRGSSVIPPLLFFFIVVVIIIIVFFIVIISDAIIVTVIYIAVMRKFGKIDHADKALIVP